MAFWTRVYALIVKEILSLFRDPKGRMVLIAPPLIQLLIFSFAATLEVKNISVVVYNQDMGRHGYEVIELLQGSPEFTDIKPVHSFSEMRAAIDGQKAIAAIAIGQDFSRHIDAGSPADVQIILDGRRSNAAQIVNGYLTQIISGYAQQVSGKGVAAVLSAMPDVAGRSWFNPNLLYIWYTVPSLVAILALLVSVVVTSLSVARERELGTFDQILVSPLLPHEILVGKTLPALIIGLTEGAGMWLFAVALFRVPFHGSFLLLMLAMLVFVMSVVGVGLFISALSKTQQQSILGAFIFMVPGISLSGYASPVENMPVWLQHATWFNPLRHMLVITKGLFLKDMTLAELWPNLWPLFVIGAITLTLSGWFFRSRLE